MSTSEIKVECATGEGKIIGQLIRQLAMTRIRSWHPIGFSINRDNTTVLYSEDGNIAQSMVTLADTLSSLTFDSYEPVEADIADPKAVVKGDLAIEEFVVRGELDSEMMQGERVYCTSPKMNVRDRDGNIVSQPIKVLNKLEGDNISNSSPLTLKVYFRYANGKYIIAQNDEFLNARLQDSSNVKVIPSIHCVVSGLTYTIEPLDFDRELLKFKVSTKDRSNSKLGELEKKVINDSIQIAIKRLEEFSRKFNG